MKRVMAISCFITTLCIGLHAQSDKTNLSLQVSAAEKANRAQLAAYVWTPDHTDICKW